jgi:uncharacterized delta-60 repeat protein
MMVVLATHAAPPNILYPPRSETVIVNQTVAVGVIASGSTPLSYQWRKNGAPISGATNDQWVIAQAQLIDAGQYSVIVSNSEATVTSSAAVLSVNTPAEGDVDFSFEPGSTINSAVRAVIRQPDGKVLIGGDFTTVKGATRNRVARLNADGTTDHTFMSGLAGPSYIVEAMALQPDGKVLIAGQFITVNGTSRNGIARLNPDGTLDTSFLNGLSGANDILAMALQPDGKILIGGYFTTVNGATRNRIARLNSDGTLDTGFLNVMPGANNTVYCLALQSDGKVLIGGDFTAVNATSRNYVARLNADGTVDSSFLDGQTGGNSVLRSIAVQGDGKVVVAGAFTTFNSTARVRVARLNSDGSLDANFNNGLSGPDFLVSTMALQSDGKVLIGGGFTLVHGTNRRCVARLNSDGSLDTGFLNGLTGADSSLEDLLVQSDGKIWIAGWFKMVNGVICNRLARLNSNGTLDTFSNGIAGPNDTVRSLAIQNDGKVVAGGTFTNVSGLARNRIARFNADGTLDTSFLNGLSGVNNSVLSVAVQSDGKVLLGGTFSTVNGTSRNRIARLNADGTLDTGFLNGLSGPDNTVNCVVVQSDGKVLIGGAFTLVNGAGRAFIARLYSDGSVDTGFMSGQFGADAAVNCISVQSDGKIVVGGLFSGINGVSRSRIARLNADGTVDTGFLNNLPGPVYSGGQASVKCLAIQRDGKIIIGGQFFEVNGVTRRQFARLHADGTLDTNFMDTAWQLNGPGPNAVAVRRDGKVFIAGDFIDVNWFNRGDGIARLNSNGSLDHTFLNNRSGADNTVSADDMIYAMALGADGKVYIGGGLVTMNGAAAAYLTRLWAFEPPAIESGPVSQTLLLGQQAFFSVTAFGTPTLTYQWRKNGSPISGATNSQFSLLHAQTADAGQYSVIVSNAYGSVTSSVAVLTVNLPVAGDIDYYFRTDAALFSTVRSVVRQPDGKLLIGGDFTSVYGMPRGYIARLNTNGTVDITFMNGLSGANARVSSIALQSDGKVIIGGSFFTVNGSNRNRVARLNADGTLDESFQDGLFGYENDVNCLTIQTDGKVLVGGSITSFTGRNFLLRLFPNGSIDSTFLSGSSGPNNAVNTIVMRNDGRMLIGGNFTMVNGTMRNRIAQMMIDASLDSDFMNFGPGANGNVNCIALQGDGKVIVGGSFTLFNDLNSRLVRLNADGMLDNFFSSNPDNEIYTVALQPNGKILIGGAFNMVNGMLRSRIARLNANGGVDTTFQNGMSGANDSVYSVALQSDGQIYIGGSFTIVNNAPAFNLARLWGSTLAQPVLISPTRLSGNGFQFQLSGPLGVSYVIQANTNLTTTNWVPLFTNTSPFTFIDAGASNHVRRFYRAMSLP